jgi:hypothetical protein
MPRKRELVKLRERAELDPVFAAEWKAKKCAEEKTRRDAKLSPEYKVAREWRRAHPEEHRKNLQRAADARRAEKRREYYSSAMGIEKQEELRRRRAKRDAWHLLHPGMSFTAHYYGTMSKEERKAFNRREQLKESGWTLESFAVAKEAQGGRCASCGDIPEVKAGRAEGLCSDHEHVKPPRPRGLLCDLCNSLIGFAKDSPERCEAAAAYLRKFLELT